MKGFPARRRRTVAEIVGEAESAFTGRMQLELLQLIAARQSVQFNRALAGRGNHRQWRTVAAFTEEKPDVP